jgi:hypothetical protein
MTKYFCDICEKEITPENNVSLGGNSSRLEGEKRYHKSLNGLYFEIITGLNKTANAGVFCKYCIIDAVKSLDDRPRAVEPK